MNFNDIARTAEEFLGSNESLPVPVDKIVEERGIKLLGYDLGHSTSGILMVEDGHATIGFNTKESKVRNRFTIAHELGHYALHIPRDNANKIFVDSGFKKILYRDALNTEKSRQETEANVFAASLLMPKALLLAETKNLEPDYIDAEVIEKLAKIFGVSTIAMSFRIGDIFRENNNY